MGRDDTVLLVLLFGLLAASLICDLRTRRIPNAIVLPGAVIAIAANTVLRGEAGAVMALEGWLCGVAILLPMYLLSAMGAGDVKLMGMVGAFIGPAEVVGAALVSLVVGGLLGLAVAASDRKLRLVFRNIAGIVRGAYLRLTGFGALATGLDIKPAGHLPYAVAICVGTVVYLLGKTVVS